MPDLMSKLVTVVEANISNFTKNIDAAQKKAASFGSSVTKNLDNLKGAFAALGVASVLKTTFNSIDDITASASKLDITTQSLQKLEYVAARTDTSFGSVEGALAKLRKRLGDATSGSEEAAKAFSNLGLDAQALAAGDLGEAYFAVGDAIQKVTGSTKQAKAAVDIFGKSGQENLNALRSNMRGLAKEAEGLGFILSDNDIAQFNKLDEAVDKLSFTIKGNLSQALVDLEPLLTGTAKLVASTASAVGKGVSTISLGISDGFTAAQELASGRSSDGGATDPNTRQAYNNRNQFRNTFANTSSTNVANDAVNAFKNITNETLKTREAFKQLGLDAIKAGASLLKTDKGQELKDLLGISPPSGQEYLGSILKPIEQITDSRFTEIATQLRNNIASGNNIGGSPESLIDQLKSISAQYVGGNVLDGQSASGMQAAIKALEQATTGIQKEQKVVVEVKVDKNGIITAFSESSSFQVTMATAVANAAAREASSTVAQ